MGFLRCQKKNFLIHMLLGLTGDSTVLLEKNIELAIITLFNQ